MLTLSIVSHGQGFLVASLLSDIKKGIGVDCKIIITLNIPEDESFLDEFYDLPILIVRNSSPLGFGANHNQAFCLSDADFFAVINPDIRLESQNLASILANFEDASVGLSAPLVISPHGTVDDSARRFPNILQLIIRKVTGRQRLDYTLGDKVLDVDWVAGMFVVFRSVAFKDIGGFDDRFFMYMEDVDICKKMSQRQWRRIIDPNVKVVHAARRASRTNLRHLYWHVSSVLKYFYKHRNAK